MFKQGRTILYYGFMIIVLIACTCERMKDSAVEKITFRQELEGSVDFDFILPGDSIPSFRLLLSEQLTTADRDLSEEAGAHHLHTLQGKLSEREGGIIVEHSFEGIFDYRLSIKPQATYVDLEVTVTNTGAKPWKDLQANFCAGLTRLPAEMPWANKDIFPEMELDRYVYGAYWFSTITPKRLKRYTGEEWVLMHPDPENPDPSKFPRYMASMSENQADKPARIVALEPEGDQPQFFIMWNVEGSSIDPFTGNACMHIIPLMARQLNIGESATIKGKSGFWGKTLDDLAALYRELEER